MIRAVMFDFGGVVTSSPFETFARYEEEAGLPVDLVRTLNSNNPDTNAWSQLERGEVDLAGFCALFEAEARELGHELDARALMEGLRGELRPDMVAAVRYCSARFKTACLTNNFAIGRTEPHPEITEVFELFDVVLESSKLGVRKPDPRFYEMACEAVGVEPAEAVYLDDLGINLKPARQMGMHTIKVVTSGQALAALGSALGVPPEQLAP
jgi:putative hydrolase of the HAD superfamily